MNKTILNMVNEFWRNNSEIFTVTSFLNRKVIIVGDSKIDFYSAIFNKYILNNFRAINNSYSTDSHIEYLSSKVGVKIEINENKIYILFQTPEFFSDNLYSSK